MKGITRVSGVAGAGKTRTIEVAPITRAIRVALAASAFALAGSGAAFAGTCTAPDAANAVSCNGDFADTLSFNLDDLTLVVGDSAPTTVTPPPGSNGIDAVTTGALGITSGASITTSDGTGIFAYGGTSSQVANTGDITSAAAATDAIGIYSYSPGGAAAVDNSGNLVVTSDTGLADGIFASGLTADVTNSGSLDVTGYTWAAGIEAQGGDATTVNNSGAIDATSTGANSNAWGVYATGGDGGIAITTTDSSAITATGSYATGIFAQDTGNGGIMIDNAGAVTATGTYYATGIHADTNVDDSNITVANSGTVNASSYYGSTGIEIVATGAGASGSLTNTGDVTVDTTGKYASTGLVVSADGDAAIDNSGSVTVTYGGFSYGALALSFAGDSTVTNSGDITVTGGFVPGYAAGYGIVSAAQNGIASASNSGAITVAGGVSQGISVSGALGASADNSGTIDATGKYVYGIAATSSQGDTTVTNSGTMNVTGDKYGLGVFARSAQGDTSVGNTGTINAYGSTLAYGVLATAALGDTSITNGVDGVINAYATGVASGIVGTATTGNVSIANDGSITATASGEYAAIALGVFGRADAGTVTISNSGDITAANDYTSARGVYALALAGDASVINTGSITASATGPGTNYLSDAIGIYAYTPGGTATVSNSGDITVSSTAGLADGIFASGLDANVSNSGTITSTGNTWGAGIEAQGDNGATVTNSGTINATAAAGDPVLDPYGYGIVLGFENGGTAYGIYATAGEGALAITTTDGSSITATGASAIGIQASGGSADGITINNAGDITATGYYASGIHAVTNAEGGDIVVGNAGDINVVGQFGGVGIEVVATGTDASGSASNSGNIVVDGPGYYGTGTGIVVSADGDASIDNSGSITSTGYYGPNYGALALAFNGTASVTNSGSITVAGGYGVVSSSQNGMANVTNSGSITVTNGTFGINASGATGTTVSNTGSVTMSDGKYNFAVQATSSLGDVVVSNSGTITSGLADGSDKYAFGVLARASQGDTMVANTGTITTTGKYSYGIEAIADLGDVSVSNGAAGVVDSSGTSVAVGIFGVATEGDVAIDNAGAITAAGIDYAAASFGAFGRADAGNVAISNSGDITATNVYGSATGVRALATLGDVSITNSGTASAIAIAADGVDYYGYAVPVNAIGLQATAGSNITVTNSGSITATDLDRAVAVSLDGATATLDNSGTLKTYTTTEGNIAVEGLGGSNTINNTGTIYGAVVMGDGADAFNNQAGGLWDVGNHATDFGAGDDAISNAADGTIRLVDASIGLGSGNNTFENQGTIHVEGSSVIDMGSGADAPPTLAGQVGPALVPSLNASPLVNDGVIDFLDGVPDDMLTIVGDLGGNGALNIDLSTLNGTSDQLYVDGSIVSGTSQHVNVGLPAGTLTTGALAAAPVVFARVSGDSTSDAFVPGDVIGSAAGNFISLGVGISSQIDASNATADLFAVQITAAGLNDTGALAASIAPGAQSLMASQIGTWRQRMGVVPRNADTGLSAFVRTFRDSGEVDQDHNAINFGNAGNFNFDQTNSGTEVGINFEPVEGINLGVTLGKADGRQRLLDGGFATDKIQANTLGIYGTWIAENGFYIDASYRAMNFNARLESAAGQQFTEGTAGAINLETGYAWTLSNGLNIEPQLQYTWTTVDSVFLKNQDAYFRSSDSDWQRGRLGVAFWKPFETASGTTWTPYGAVSAVYTADSAVGYAVNDSFFGNTNTQGTSALVELGVGMQKNGFSASAGANWQDGGALQSFVGGQVVLRYDW